jgi:hypothetical protein
MTTNATLYVDQGVDFGIALDLFDAEGLDFNISDQQFKCEVRKLYSSNLAFEAVVQLNTDDNDINNLDLIIPGNLTANLSPGKYQYDIVMFDGVYKSKILEGLIFLLPTITKYTE